MGRKLHKPVFPWDGDSSPRLPCLAVLIQEAVWDSKGIETAFNRSWYAVRDMWRRGLHAEGHCHSSPVFLQVTQLTFLQSTQLQSIRAVGMSNRPLPTFCQSGIWAIRNSEGKIKGEVDGGGFWSKGGNKREEAIELVGREP